MSGEVLTQILVLLAGSLLVLALVRRFSLPPILGYLLVGMLLGPHALGVLDDDESVRTLADVGVVFLVFTLGLEFSFARMIAMKSEVLGVGGLRLLLAQLPLVLLLLVALLVVKAAIVAAIVRGFVHNTRKALRTGITVCMGGELGFALLTVLLNGRLVPTELVQPMLTAVVLSMLVGPLMVRYNGRIANRLLGRESTLPSDGVFETAATRDIAKREHVLICGFGRVGQNLARVLEKRGFEFIALDIDPFRVRDARQAGDPVVYGDAAQVDVLRALGLDRANVVVVSVDALEPAVGIVRAVRQLRTDVPVLVRTEDDSGLERLQVAGATEGVPEIFETALSIVSHVLLYLDVPPTDVAEMTEDIRHDRYVLLRSVFRRRDALEPASEHALLRQHLRTVTLPPAAYGVVAHSRIWVRRRKRIGECSAPGWDRRTGPGSHDAPAGRRRGGLVRHGGGPRACGIAVADGLGVLPRQ